MQRYVGGLSSVATFSQASITTRLPKVGEQLIISGFRASSSVFESTGGAFIDLGAEMLLCSGVVTARYPAASGRDRVTAPWPCIEVDCPSWGGMSGGPVFDQRGFIVGLISKGWNCVDDPSPMVTALLWPALGLQMKSFGWPPSLGSAGRSLLNMKEC
jgi:Trypsin-like peptidase domain